MLPDVFTGCSIALIAPLAASRPYGLFERTRPSSSLQRLFPEALVEEPSARFRSPGVLGFANCSQDEDDAASSRCVPSGQGERTRASAIRSQGHRRLRRSASAVAARRFEGIAARTASTARLYRIPNYAGTLSGSRHNRSMGQATDGDLWRRAVDGDPDAFGLLFERHAQGVYNYLFRRTADGRSQKT